MQNKYCQSIDCFINHLELFLVEIHRSTTFFRMFLLAHLERSSRGAYGMARHPSVRPQILATSLKLHHNLDHPVCTKVCSNNFKIGP